MKLKFMDPDTIMNVIVALIVLAVGIFAFFVTVSNIPTVAPTSNRLTGVSGNLTIGAADTYEYIPVTSQLNDTTVCQLCAHKAGGWDTIQAVGAANGTFMSNNTYRVEQGTTHAADAYVIYNLTYTQLATPTSTLSNATYNAILNSSGTGNSVFNIVGVVLIIGAIMSIVGLVYSYIKPGTFGG